MRKKIKYITQLTSGDISDILCRGNVTSGQGILVENTEDGIKISLDKDSLKYILWTYVNNATTAVNTVGLTDLTNVPIDPA